MNRKQKNMVKAIQAMDRDTQVKTIQAMGIEGVNFEVALDSMLDGRPINGIEGTENGYMGYSAQTTAIYKKFNGEAEYGNDQVRTMVDARVAFIAGEGMSITPGKKATGKHMDLIKKFVEKNRLNSTRLFDTVRTTEMQGYAVTSIKKTNADKDFIPMFGLNVHEKEAFIFPVYSDPSFPYDVQELKVRKAGKSESEKVAIPNAVYIRTGGTGSCLDAPVTKIGIILTEADNYDRALKDMRLNNYICARVTPDFETKTPKETKEISEMLIAGKWKVGDSRIGTAKFSYKVPGTGANDMLLKEMTSTVKTMSGTTGVPIHWFGWVDQLSNRATATELYAMVNNATIMERSAIEDAFKELLILMQQEYIDAGGKDIKEFTDDFEVKLPLIDFGRFESMVKAYSLLYADEIISEDTYRSVVPGVDPQAEKSKLEKAAKEAEKNMITKSEIPEEGEEDNPEEDDDGSK